MSKMSFFDFEAKDAAGKPYELSRHRGSVVLAVNVASKCGFTPQYSGLEQLYRTYASRGFVVIGFPSNQFLFQEPGSNEAIQEFCRTEYDVTFPVLGKIAVNGFSADPVFEFLKKNAPGQFGLGTIKWNFTKFLIDREGNVVERFAPTVEPQAIAPEIDRLLT